MRNELRSSGHVHARSAQDARAFEAVAKRIHDDYPSVSVDAIVTLLRRSYERTEDATVQAFRGLLAERDARTELRQPWPQVVSIETLENERLKS